MVWGSMVRLVRSSAIAEKPRDASCLSVVSLNSTIAQAQSFIIPPTKEEVNAFARVRLYVCLSVSKITQKRVLTTLDGPAVIDAEARFVENRDSCRNIATTFGTDKLERCGYPTVKKVSEYIYLFRHVTDTQADGHHTTA